jgi:type II secretory pathway component PulF
MDDTLQNTRQNTRHRAFNLTWRFVAQQRDGGQRKTTGLVQAPNAVMATTQVKRMGFIKPVVRPDVGQSLSSGLGFITPMDFDLRDKARLFETLGKRLQLGAPITTSLETAQEYVQDGRLKAALATMSAQIQDGQPTHTAMINAGFVPRDAMVVRALSESGQTFQAFLDLAAEAKARAQRTKALDSALRMPKIMMVVLFAALPAFFLLMGPQMLKTFKQLGPTVNIPPSIQSIYSSVEWVNAHVELAAVMYLTLIAATVALWTSSLWTHVAMRIKTFRDLSLKSEHASIWSVYAMMYAAGIAPQNICDILRPTAKLPSSEQALKRMSKRLRAGGDDAAAVSAAGFPTFVVAGYKAARDSGSLSEGLKSFTAMLGEDIEVLTEQAQQWLQIVSLMLMSAGVMGMFFLMYYPIAGVALSNA